MNSVYLVAARRTPVAPVNGAFKTLSVADLAVPVVHQVLADAGLHGEQVGQVILGNALYGGGNPARLTALAAGLPEALPAMTVDTQCCSGLDALRLGAQAIAAGQADVVLAGGVESTSRRALRYHRPLTADVPPEPYERPPFTPWPARDPDMADSAARMAQDYQVSLEEQNAWAMGSHAKALATQARLTEECVPLAGLTLDPAARALTDRVANRTPVIARAGDGCINVAGAALQADAAAVCVLVSARVLATMPTQTPRLRWQSNRAGASAADNPPEAIIPVVRALLAQTGLTADDFHCVELMEAYAVQALVNCRALGLPYEAINRRGGALARGHPIGASGAILAVQAFHELARAESGSRALLAIAAAGGLASAAVLER